MQLGSRARNKRVGRLILRPCRQRRCSSETSVEFQLTTRRYIPEDSIHNHRCENFKSSIQFRDLSWRNEESHEKCWSGQTTYCQIFEPGTSRISLSASDCAERPLLVRSLNFKDIDTTFKIESTQVNDQASSQLHCKNDARLFCFITRIPNCFLPEVLCGLKRQSVLLRQLHLA
jgi:hypothetical protein